MKAQGQVIIIIIMPKTEDLANKSAASFPPFHSPPTSSGQRRPLPHAVSSARQRRSHGHNLDAVPPPPPRNPSKQCSRHLSDWPVCLRLQEEPSDGVCDRCLSGTMHLVCIHVRAPSLRAADRDGCLHVQALRESERM